MATKPKRGQNEGSIYERGDGRFAAVISLPGGRRKTLYARTKREALAKLRDFQLKMEQGLADLDSAQNLETYLKHWLEDVAQTRVKRSTYEGYEQLMRTRVVPVLGKKKLSEVTGQHIQALLAELSRRGMAPSTVLKTRMVLHSAFKQAVRWRLILRNPVDDTDPPKRRRIELRTLSPEEVRRLVEAAPEPVFRALFALAATAGLRRGEVLGLKWSDLNLEAKTMSVRRSLFRAKGGGYLLEEPKTSRARRLVRLTSFAVEELRELRIVQEAARKAAAELWHDGDFVFASSVGTPLQEHRLSVAYKATLTRAGLPDVRFHDLRHTAATVAMESGVHAKVVQEMLGHANISITLDIYSHVTPDMQEEAVEKLNSRYGL